MTSEVQVGTSQNASRARGKHDEAAAKYGARPPKLGTNHLDALRRLREKAVMMAFPKPLSSAERMRAPVQEPIHPGPSESFVWRRDNYPLPWSVWNSHPECEIHLICSSHGTCHVGDHIGEFSPGDLFLIGRNLPHDWVTPVAPGETIAGRDVLVQFDQNRLFKAAELLPEIHRLERLLKAAERGLCFRGDARRVGSAVLEEMEAASGLERLSLFLRLLDVLARSDDHRVLSSAHFSAAHDSGSDAILRDVLRRLSSGLAEDIRLADMAAMAGMSETSFSRFFKRKTGHTFTRYLSELRIGRACQILASSTMPITDICHEAGYNNLSNFNRTFLSLRGLTPSNYRRLASR